MSEELEGRAKARGWPEGLLARALAAHSPSGELEWLLSPDGPSLKNVEKTIEVFERLASGPLRARELSGRDLESFSALWANAGEPLGEWEVTVERAPDPMAQFRLQDDVCISVVEDCGAIVACTAWTGLNTVVGGQPGYVICAHSLRVRNDRRREGLGDIVRRFPPRATLRPAIGQFMYVRTANAGMDDFLRSVGFQEDRERPQKEVAVAHFTARETPADPAVRRVEDKDIDACVALINRTQAGLDLFRPLSAERFRLQLDEGFCGLRPQGWRSIYGWRDMFVLEEQGRVVACGGLWDRGRDVRERWRSSAGEIQTIEVAALLDFGFEAGREHAMARLVRAMASRAAGLGRGRLIAPLEHLPEVGAMLADLDPREERRILEWTPYMPAAPKALGRTFNDLRYW